MRLLKFLAVPILLSMSPVMAACLDQDRDQTIVLKKNGNTVVFADESQKSCPIRHGTKDRFVIWRFQNMKQDCMNSGPGKCRIDLQNVDTDSKLKVQCRPDQQDFICQLNVRRLKTACHTADPHSTDCTLTYMVYYDGIEVDPTIIINPRPSID